MPDSPQTTGTDGEDSHWMSSPSPVQTVHSTQSFILVMNLYRRCSLLKMKSNQMPLSLILGVMAITQTMHARTGTLLQMRIRYMMVLKENDRFYHMVLSRQILHLYAVFCCYFQCIVVRVGDGGFNTEPMDDFVTFEDSTTGSGIFITYKLY